MLLCCLFVAAFVGTTNWKRSGVSEMESDFSWCTPKCHGWSSFSPWHWSFGGHPISSDYPLDVNHDHPAAWLPWGLRTRQGNQMVAASWGCLKSGVFKADCLFWTSLNWITTRQRMWNQELVIWWIFCGSSTGEVSKDAIHRCWVLRWSSSAFTMG